MKRFSLSILVLVAAAIVGCDKISENSTKVVVPGELQAEPEYGNVFFNFSAPGEPSTKSSIITDDNTIGTAQVAVFDGDTKIAFESKSIGAISGTVEVKGMKMGTELDCYAVINGPDISGCATKADIEAVTVELKNYGTSNLPMYASGKKTFTKEDKSITLSLERAASKIEIQKVSAQFISAAIAALDAKVNAIYIYNAPGKYRISLSDPASQVWYHKTGYSAADAAALGAAASLVGETGLEGVITGNTSYTTGHDFYCCPNAGDTTWLTIETVIGGKTYYYGVQMAELKANTKYIITNAILTGYGADTPPGIVDNGTISVNLTVKDWTEGSKKEVTF